MLQAGWKDRFAAAVTHRFSLDNVNEAMEHTRAWRGGKTVIVP
jgi:Zn-dependent alcohol dehydrogenase